MYILFPEGDGDFAQILVPGKDGLEEKETGLAVRQGRRPVDEKVLRELRQRIDVGKFLNLFPLIGRAEGWGKNLGDGVAPEEDDGDDVFVPEDVQCGPVETVGTGGSEGKERGERFRHVEPVLQLEEDRLPVEKQDALGIAFPYGLVTLAERNAGNKHQDADQRQGPGEEEKTARTLGLHGRSQD